MTLRDTGIRRIYDKDRVDSEAWYRRLLKPDAVSSTTRDIILTSGDASSTDQGEASRQRRPRLRTIPGSYSSEESNMEISAAYSLNNELREEPTDLSSIMSKPTTEAAIVVDDHEELTSINNHQANLLRQGISYEPSQEELEQITSRYALRGSADSGSEVSWGSSARYHVKTSSNASQESKHSIKHTLARPMNRFSRSSDRMVPITPMLTPSLPQVRLDPINPRKDAHRHDRMTASASTAQLANRLHVPTRVVPRRRSIATSQPNVLSAEVIEPYISRPQPRPLPGRSRHSSVGGEQDNAKTEQHLRSRTGTLYDYSQITSTDAGHSQVQGSTQPGFSLVVRQPTVRHPSSNVSHLHNDSLPPMQQQYQPQEEPSKPDDNVTLQSSSGTEYWGFAPSFKDRVEEALVSALNRVRQRTTSDSKYRVAAKSYQKIISEDLARTSSSIDNLLQYDTDTVVSDISNAQAEARGSNNDVNRGVSDQETARTALSVVLPQSLKLDPQPHALYSQTFGADTSQAVMPVQQYGAVLDSELASIHDTNSAMETMGATRSELDFFINLGDPHEEVDSFRSVQLTPMVENEDFKTDTEASRPSEYIPTTIQRRDSATITNDQEMQSSTARRLQRLVSLAHTHADTETSRYPDGETENQIMHYNPDDNATQISLGKRGSVASESTTRRRTLSWLKDVFTTSGPQKVQVVNGPPEALGVARSRTAPALTTNSLEVIRDKRPALHREHVNAVLALPKACFPKPNVNHIPQITQTFTKTIEDLENLLAEALQIAHEAAERQDDQELPGLLASAADVLEYSKSELELSNIIDPASSAAGLPSLLVSAGAMSEPITNLHENSPNSASNSVLKASRPISNCAIVEKPYVVEPSCEDLQSVPTEHGLPLITDIPETPMTFGNPEHHKALMMNQQTNEAFSCTSEIPLYDNQSLLLEENGTKIVIDVESDHVNTGVAFMPDTRHEVDMTSFLPQIKENIPSATIPHPGQRVSLASLQSSSQDCALETTISRKETVKGTHKSVLKGMFTTDKAPPSSMDEMASTRIVGQRSLVPDKREVHEFIRVFHQPPLHPRNSSYSLRRCPEYANLPAREGPSDVERSPVTKEVESFSANSIQTMDGFESDDHDVLAFSNPTNGANQDNFRRRNTPKQDSDGFELVKMNIPGKTPAGSTNKKSSKYVSLKGKSHINIAHHKGFSLARHHKRAPLARDWSPFRKRFAASVICVSTAMIGILIGIYAGMVPSIQYYIADQNHTAILGNVFFYIGLAIPTFVAWPLPLLHGRKPYILASLSLAMPLLFPQGVMVQQQRSPYAATFRVGLILPRAFMGIALGLAQMNFMATLLDLFGASLMAVNPHQEVVDDFDVRRHGGGMGIWLGLWTWCYTGSIGIGFLIGCAIINTQTPAWGFYVSIVIIACVLVLNIVTPEVRRSAFRRSVVEVKRKGQTERRLGRGEVMMHRIRTGPKWWAQEVHHGILLSMDMLKQPGFLVVLAYSAWTYGQITLIIVLLGSLMSKEYRFKSPEVGFCALAIPIGGFLAIPFTKASLFSRARDHAVRRDSATFEKQFTWTSHLVRRSIFTFVLPVVGLAYTLSSEGPPIPFILPIIFAGLLSFLSNLAIAECNGLIMDTFDTSDLHPGMTGRSRRSTESGDEGKRTNYSSFPRVASAFALCQGFGFLVAAVATGVGGVAQRHLGQRAATGVMEAFLLVFTILLLGVLVRWKEVQIIPTAKTGDMEKWEKARRDSLNRSETRARTWNSAKVALGPNTPSQAPVEEEEPWRPIIIGNPSGKTRRMNILEMGRLSRWSEIRQENRLIDAGSLEEQHPERYIVQRVVSRIEGHNAAVDEQPKAVTRMKSKRGSKKNRGQPLLAPDSSPMGEMEPDEDGDVLPPLVDTLKPGSREPLRRGSKTDGR